MQPLLPLVFVLYMANPGRKVPEAHIGVLRLEGGKRKKGVYQL